MSETGSASATSPQSHPSVPGDISPLHDQPRGTRLADEFQYVDAVLRRKRIMSTVVIFGSSRVTPEAVSNPLQNAPGSMAHSKASVWYAMAREFAKLVSTNGGAIGPPGSELHNVIATGGGPGLMEAANRGASESGAPSIGFNIVLPVEQPSNSYTTPDLTFQLHYFAMRKMHLAMRANALAVFPGGFGTLDELFELLTLKQTGKGKPIPIILFDRAFWSEVVNFAALADMGMIAREDLDLFDFADSAEEGWSTLLHRGLQIGSGTQS